jgi:hypothetical protein
LPARNDPEAGASEVAAAASSAAYCALACPPTVVPLSPAGAADWLLAELQAAMPPQIVAAIAQVAARRGRFRNFAGGCTQPPIVKKFLR